jgi:hypothetical protein
MKSTMLSIGMVAYRETSEGLGVCEPEKALARGLGAFRRGGVLGSGVDE